MSSNTNFVTSAVSGINLTNISDTAEFAVGTIVNGNNGSVWQYVYAGSGIAQYNAVLVNGSGTAFPSTTALAASTKTVGFAQVAITSGYYGWVARAGFGLTAMLAASCAAGAQLYTTSTAGTLDDAVVTAGALPGVICVVAASAGGVTNTTISAGQSTITASVAPG